jgi:hypothetical protein
MTVENRLLERIGKEFAYSEQATVVELLSSYAGPQAERVRWDILKLSNGNLEKVRQYIEAAWAGYCDLLCWPRYFDDHPILRPWGPKKLLEQILAKCGVKAPKIA